MVEQALERLKREIHHARSVAHSNVCRVFDLGHHRKPGGGEVLFLTMELLEGETLAKLLKRVGRMTTTEAWPLVEQMAAGLNAAHQAGVVHRDFKPGNVILVPVVESHKSKVESQDRPLLGSVLISPRGHSEHPGGSCTTHSKARTQGQRRPPWAKCEP